MSVNELTRIVTPVEWHIPVSSQYEHC